MAINRRLKALCGALDSRSVLRLTENYLVTKVPRGVLITADCGFPRNRLVRQKTWSKLAGLDDDALDVACHSQLRIGSRTGRKIGVNEVNLLRRTAHFNAYQSARGVRIVARTAHPRSRVVKQSTYNELRGYKNDTFDAACCLELGIGVHVRR